MSEASPDLHPPACASALLFDVTGEDLAGVGQPLWGFALTPGRRAAAAQRRAAELERLRRRRDEP